MAIIKESESFADIKVQIVSALPDLCVYVTKQKFEAKGRDDVWFFDDSFPDKKVKFVRHLPDLKVQYVRTKSAAGWKNKQHKLQNRIG